MKRLWPPLLILAVFAVLAVAGDFYFGLSAEAMGRTREILGYAVQVGIWLSAAFLLNRLVQVFVWDGLVTSALHGPVPRLMKDLTTVIIFLVAIAVIVGVVFDRSVAGIWATSGVLGLVLGLALRPMILDVFTGLAINVDGSFSIGDWILIHGRQGAMDQLGEIVEFNWRTTRLLTTERNLLVIPNSQIGTMIVTNYKRPEITSRFEAEFCLDFSVPVERARRIILAGVKAALSQKGMLEDPPPKVLVDSTSSLGVEYKVRYWIEPWLGITPSLARDVVATSVVKHLQQAGISLAYPKRDVFRADMPTRHLDSEAPEHREQLLQRVEIFAALPSEEISALSQNLTRRLFAEGDRVIGQGEGGDSMFILMEGLLTVHVSAEGADEETRVGLLEPGDFFGEMSLLTGEPRSATIRAATDVVAYELTHESMSELLARRPDLADTVGEAAAKRRIRLAEAVEARTTAEFEADSKTLAAKILTKMRSFFGGVFSSDKTS